MIEFQGEWIHDEIPCYRQASIEERLITQKSEMSNCRWRGIIADVADWDFENDFMPRKEGLKWTQAKQEFIAKLTERKEQDFPKSGCGSNPEFPSWKSKFEMCDWMWFEGISSFYWLVLHVKIQCLVECCQVATNLEPTNK